MKVILISEDKFEELQKKIENAKFLCSEAGSHPDRYSKADEAQKELKEVLDIMEKEGGYYA